MDMALPRDDACLHLLHQQADVIISAHMRICLQEVARRRNNSLLNTFPGYLSHRVSRTARRYECRGRGMWLINNLP